MSNPKYRVRASGLGGSGYVRPPRSGELCITVKNADGEYVDAVIGDDGKPIVVPGATTVLKAFGDGPGLVQWKIDQTVAYAVANVDALMNRTPEQGFGFLRWYHKRTPDLNDPLVNAHSGVLNDLAELGTSIHEYAEADVMGEFLPDIETRQLAEMVSVWEDWRFVNEVEPVFTECTVYGDGWAGTFDGLWLINGRLSLLDIKSSRSIGDSHMMQLSALRHAMKNGELLIETAAGSVWIDMNDVPEIEEYAFLQIRPNDDNKPAFVDYHVVSEDELDIHYENFLNLLHTLQNGARLRKLRKEREV